MSETDWIRRQDAIDANCEDWCGCKYKDCQHKSEKNKYCDGCDTVGVLKELPSSQPERNTEFVKLTVRDINGKPYYSIIYLEDGNEIGGYSSYSLDVVSDYLKKFFMPSAQPEIKTDGDTISREDAINAFKEWVTSGESNMRADSNARLYERLKNLPSVQDEIIRCKDCKWFGLVGCAVLIIDDDDKPTENDYCSFGERGKQDDSD